MSDVDMRFCYICDNVFSKGYSPYEEYDTCTKCGDAFPLKCPGCQKGLIAVRAHVVRTHPDQYFTVYMEEYPEGKACFQETEPDDYDEPEAEIVTIIECPWCGHDVEQEIGNEAGLHQVELIRKNIEPDW
jgi:hypothetical protein